MIGFKVDLCSFFHHPPQILTSAVELNTGFSDRFCLSWSHYFVSVAESENSNVDEAPEQWTIFWERDSVVVKEVSNRFLVPTEIDSVTLADEV